LVFLIEHPDFTKILVSFLTLFFTNFLLFYDFYYQLIKDFFLYCLEFKLISDCFYWTNNFIIEVLAIFENLYLTCMNFWTSVNKYIFNFLFTSINLLQDASNSAGNSLTNIRNISMMLIVDCWNYLCWILSIVFSCLSYFFTMMYKCCGIFCLTIICFYLLLYLTDFVDFVIKNKRAFELYKKVTKLVVSLLVILKRMFVIFLKSLFSLLKYHFYESFLENTSTYPMVEPVIHVINIEPCQKNLKKKKEPSLLAIM
jgi:hypothetical protein